jgi:hypothetical protein
MQICTLLAPGIRSLFSGASAYNCLGLVMKLTFFHQKRKDEAVRTGVEVEDELLLQKFTPGMEDKDSALLWYVDVRCGLDKPIDAEPSAARTFLESIAEPISRTLSAVADELQAGLDSEVWPLQRKIESLPEDVKGEVVCSAMKRSTDGEIAGVLRHLGRIGLKY